MVYITVGETEHGTTVIEGISLEEYNALNTEYSNYEGPILRYNEETQILRVVKGTISYAINLTMKLTGISENVYQTKFFGRNVCLKFLECSICHVFFDFVKYFCVQCENVYIWINLFHKITLCSIFLPQSRILCFYKIMYF